MREVVMGAGSSARKVKAEKTLREEAERRAEYEESVRKQLSARLFCISFACSGIGANISGLIL